MSEQLSIAKRKLVIIESPFAGDQMRHLDYLGECIRDSIFRNEAPFASHGLYTRWLDDFLQADRQTGIECGYAWMSSADLVAFYYDLGVSAGMRKALEYCARNGYRIEFRALGGRWLNG